MTSSKNLKAKVLNNLDDERIKAFLIEADANAVFQSCEIYEMFRYFENNKPVAFIVEDAHKIKGLLITIIQKEHAGILGYFSARSVIIGGPIVLHNDLDVLELLLMNYNSQIKSKAIYSQFRNVREFSSEEKGVFKKCGYLYDAHLNIIHDLTVPVEEQWMKLHKGRRKNIRRTERLGLVFREIENDDEFVTAYNIVKETYRRVKLPIPYNSVFTKSYSDLLAFNLLKVFVAVIDDEIIATRMVLCYRGLIYDWIAGASEKHLDKYPNDFLPWKVMEWGSQNNFKYFDFGGAGKPNIHYGVRDHKLKFGGELVEHGRFEKVHNKLLFNIGKIGLKLYKMIK